MIKNFYIFFFYNACGYQPIYLNKNEMYLKYNFIGDKKINRKIISYLNQKRSKIQLKMKLILENKRINETSKDSKGQVASL